MSLLERNILANYGGKTVTALIGFAVVPVYLKYVGVEAYGLISFFISLQAVIAVLDIGLSSASNRETGLISVTNSRIDKTRHLLRTMEFIYYGVAIFIFIVFSLSSDFLAYQWLQSKDIAPDTIKQCVYLAGATIALRWPISLYSGILLGTEKHVLFNSISTIIAIVRAIGSVLVVIFLSSPLVSFYMWQGCVSFLELIIMFAITWRILGGICPFENIFDVAIFKNVWRFSMGIAGITVCAMFLKQTDKLIISKMLPLDQLGYYNTAYLLSTGMLLVFQPVQSAVFPRFTKLFAKGDTDQLSVTFHRTAQMVAVLASPAACIMAFFSKEILLLWTQSEIVAVNASMPLSLLGFAALFNAMMGIPFILQLATGITWLPLYNNSIALLVITPLIYFFVVNFGIWGGALAWLIYNILYFTILPYFMFRYVLIGQKRHWYFVDTIPFMILALVIFYVVRLICNMQANPILQLTLVILGTSMYFIVGVLFSKTLRSYLFSFFPLEKYSRTHQ